MPSGHGQDGGSGGRSTAGTSATSDPGAAKRAQRGRGRRIGVAVVASLVAVVVALMLALGTYRDVRLNSGLLMAASIKAQLLDNNREMCLYRALRRELPRDASFYDNPGNYEHFQRIAEAATLWAVPRLTLAAARWDVAIVPGHCAGIALKVWRR
jgi:hypothetical protein